MSMSATSFNVSTPGPHQRPLARGRQAAEPMGGAMLGSPAHSLPAPSRHRRPAPHAACTHSAHRHAG
eukprot:13305717-Heterocapsa_arctica.AAC.1